MRDRGYPPSVREIGEAVGLTSPVHRAQPPRHAPAARVPAPRPRPSPAPSRSASTPTPAPPSSAGRSATCPSSATSPPAPTCWPQENVEEVLPLPADFTGDGDLFMLRVRGDSMVDAGILDGDFVVARQQDSAEHGRHRGGRHPGRGGHREDVQPQGRQGRAAAGQHPARADGVRPRRRAIFGEVVTVLRRL